MNNALKQKMTDYVKSKLSEKATAISFAVMRDGKVHVAAALGTTDGKSENQAQVEDLYNIGSVSKCYCAVAIMKLVEDGKVKLDDPVYKYLPKFKMLDPRYKDITIKMTLCHESGLPGTHWKNSFSSKYLGDRYYDDFYEYLSKSYLKAAPGEFATYCNDGFTLAEMLIAEVSGMSYSEFVKKYITDPIGAYSTCYSDKLTEGRKHVAMKGTTGIEYLSVMGAGGTNTDMTDLCKFGNMFLDPKGTFKKEILMETAKPSGRAYIGKEEYPKNGFGLGWDTVAFANPKYNFGEKVLLKSGGTLQFLSYLIVIPKYNAVGAISGTSDCGTDNCAILCELLAMLLEDQDIDVRVNVEDTKREFNNVPEDIKRRFTGKYVSQYGPVDVSFTDTEMFVTKMIGDKGSYMLSSPIKYSDGMFYDKNNLGATFEESKGIAYLCLVNPNYGKMPMAESVTSLPAVNEGWRARSGKRYILCNGTAEDLAGIMLAPALECIIPDYLPGLVLFQAKPDPSLVGEVTVLPFSTIDDNTGKMFLHNRDIFAPFAFIDNGVEKIYCYGLEYIDASSLKPITPGKVKISGVDKNAVFVIPANMKPVFEVPEGGRALIINDNLETVYDSLPCKDSKEYNGGGYAIMMGKDGCEFNVSVWMLQQG